MDEETSENEEKNLEKLIEILTHSGLRVLDENIFKQVKKACRSSPELTRKAYYYILHQLKKHHSEIRHLAFQMCVELFKRSALFRELTVKDLKVIFELTVETNPKKKLPPPRSLATILERLALSTIKKWTEEFGDVFKELQIALHYLKHVKRVNFDVMSAENEVDMQRQRREETLKKEKMDKLVTEIDSVEPEIDSTLTSLTNCMSLLVPSLDDFFIQGTDNGSEDCSAMPNTIKTEPREGDCHKGSHEEGKCGSAIFDLKHHGITSNYGIIITPGTSRDKLDVRWTTENAAVIQNAEDNVKLIKNRFLPLIKKWNQMCMKYSAENGETIQRILKLKEKLDACVTKYGELNIQEDCETKSCNSNDDDDDDDLEEVTKEHYESTAADVVDFNIINVPSTSQRKRETEWKISFGEDGDPTSALSTLKRLQENEATKPSMPSTSQETSESKSTLQSVDETKTSDDVPDTEKERMSRKRKLLAQAPKLPFDIDLYHWEDQNLTAPTLLSIKMDNPKFWGASSVDDMEEIPNPDGIAALRTRIIEFSGKFEPVKWACRAPLANGKLCPRRDRFKCPFHGKIVPRDERGVRQDEPGKEATASTSFAEDTHKVEPDWQDPELLHDIKMATGVDLTIPTKRSKGRKGRTSKVKEKSKTHKVMRTSSSTLSEIEKRKYPGLTDTIGKQRNNSYKRISRKIFKRSALNKVATTLDKIDFIKHRDKFGDQFNYVHGT